MGRQQGYTKLPVTKTRPTPIKIKSVPPATVEEIANRASSLRMSYGEYVSSDIYMKDKISYFPFLRELKKAKQQREAGA